MTAHSGTALLFGAASSVFLTLDFSSVMFFSGMRDSITDKASMWLSCVVKNNWFECSMRYLGA